MAASARIDELRHRYAAQPRRYFAPLANALRESGALEDAVTMLRAQLAEHPDHLIGHVVLGQSLFDAGALTEARVAFEAARALDPGNRVVLRYLGEIASLGGDATEARTWFERLRAAEPYADDVAAQLGGGPEFPPDIEPGAEDAFEPAGFELLEFEAAAFARAPHDAGRVAVDVAPSEAGPDDAPSVESASAPASAFDPVVGLDAAPPTVPDELAAATLPPLAQPQPAFDPAPDTGSSDEDHADWGEGRPAEPGALYATETMAGLLADQGHTEQAIALFERLVADRPDDVALRARLERLQHSVGAPSTPQHVGVAEASADASARADDGPGQGDAARGAILTRAFADLPRHGRAKVDLVATVAKAAAAAAVVAVAAIAAATLPAPEERDASAASGASDPAVTGDADPFADVSFDRFFAGADVPAPDAPLGPATESPELDAALDDADLARFDVWLRDAA